MSLYHLLRQLSSKYRVTIAYNDEDVFYYLIITQLNIRLTFDFECQLLLFIEIVDLSRVSLTYQDHSLKDYKFQTVYDHYFGPTYPGELKNSVYTLNYPGLSFRFNVENTKKLQGITDASELLRQVMATNPKASSIAIHHLSKWSEFKTYGFKAQTVDRLAVDDIEVSEIRIKGIQHDEEGPNTRDGFDLDVHFFKHPRLENFSLVIDRSLQQDVLAELGPPDEVFLKNDSRSSIHGRSPVDDKSKCVFHNYFRYGFDLLYTMTRSGGVLTKVVLHGNLPESVLFGKYRKCNWRCKRFQDEELAQTEADLANEEVVINRSELLGNSMELIDGNWEKNENEIEWGKSVVFTYNDHVVEYVHGRINAITLF